MAEPLAEAGCCGYKGDDKGGTEGRGLRAIASDWDENGEHDGLRSTIRVLGLGLPAERHLPRHEPNGARLVPCFWDRQTI